MEAAFCSLQSLWTSNGRILIADFFSPPGVYGKCSLKHSVVCNSMQLNSLYCR